MMIVTYLILTTIDLTNIERTIVMSNVWCVLYMFFDIEKIHERNSISIQMVTSSPQKPRCNFREIFLSS